MQIDYVLFEHIYDPVMFRNYHIISFDFTAQWKSIRTLALSVLNIIMIALLLTGTIYNNYIVRRVDFYYILK